MKWLIFIGLKLMELAVAAAVIFVIYLFFTLTPGKVIAIMFLTTILAAVATLVVYDNPPLNRTYWQHGVTMRIVGIITFMASIPLAFMAVGWVSYYIGTFYNWLGSLVGWHIIQADKATSFDYVVTGLVFTFGILLILVLGILWIHSNVKWAEKLDNQRKNQYL